MERATYSSDATASKPTPSVNAPTRPSFSTPTLVPAVAPTSTGITQPTTRPQQKKMTELDDLVLWTIIHNLNIGSVSALSQTCWKFYNFFNDELYKLLVKGNKLGSTGKQGRYNMAIDLFIIAINENTKGHVASVRKCMRAAFSPVGDLAEFRQQRPERNLSSSQRDLLRLIEGGCFPYLSVQGSRNLRLLRQCQNELVPKNLRARPEDGKRMMDFNSVIRYLGQRSPSNRLEWLKRVLGSATPEVMSELRPHLKHMLLTQYGFRPFEKHYTPEIVALLLEFGAFPKKYEWRRQDCWFGVETILANTGFEWWPRLRPNLFEAFWERYGELCRSHLEDVDPTCPVSVADTIILPHDGSFVDTIARLFLATQVLLLEDDAVILTSGLCMITATPDEFTFDLKVTIPWIMPRLLAGRRASTYEEINRMFPKPRLG
ncbi:hypothetical protein QBC46DRAFT_420490 [Diplogelasinospora grovesii]|uniref:Uncharacterized protein n=1 Tax=Diplogelasinospora grovesii TaxID=303347 RepID=A0AAN6S0J3_9PEZI|nr:hypothetical protein QBC46DRAFT_420490 [Diplogelasinospora grovesii]